MFVFIVFFFNDTATTEIYTLSLHDALPISLRDAVRRAMDHMVHRGPDGQGLEEFIVRNGTASSTLGDRKSTRLNSSHSQISYAVFCLKKKRDRTQIYKRPFRRLLAPLPALP